MSLLGKPINYNRGSRRDARYRRLQSRVYNFLERPRGVPAILYHIMVFLMVFTCLALSVFSTIEEYEHQALQILFVLEIVVVIWFIMEFFLRLWSSGCRSRYQGTIGRFKFLKRPFCIIDVVTISASLVVLGMGDGQVFATSALRGLRFFQILRMVRMDRRGGTWKLLGSVVYAHRQELITTMYIGFLGLIFASFLVYLMEKDEENTKFTNFAQALWWGVITLCTVGYGDMVPDTWQGKVIASFCALLGISFFALPAGILGSGFALKVQQQQRQKHMIRRRQPAATLIQSLWRCYAADEHSVSIATWKIHQVPLPSPPPSRASSSFKHNASFVARLPTIRRHKSQSLNSPGNAVTKSAGPTISRTGTIRCRGTAGDMELSADNLDIAISKKNSDDEDEEPRCIQLTNQHKTAIRFIRKMKYFVARRKFKEALKPYDVKDVMEQYAAGHVDILGRVKNVQTRLDQILGKQGSKAKDVYASKISLASRVVKVERSVVDIEEKLDAFIRTYMQDRENLLVLPKLTQQIQHSTNFDQNPPDGGGGTGDGSSAVTNNSLAVIEPVEAINPIIVSTSYRYPQSGESTKKNIDLISRNQFSEPNSPIVKTFEESSTARANTPVAGVPRCGHYPDLGHRIKKRVTLSSIPQPFVNATNTVENKDNVVIVVPELDTEKVNISGEYLDPNSTKTLSDSSILLVDEEMGEDIEENDLFCEGEIDTESSTWDLYKDGLECDNEADNDTENTALLKSNNTSIIVTPISPVSSALDLERLEEQSKNNVNTLRPDATTRRLLSPGNGVDI